MTWLHFALFCMVLTVAKTFLAKKMLQTIEPQAFVFFDTLTSTLMLVPFLGYFDWQAVSFSYFLILFLILAPTLLGMTYLSKATKDGEVSEVTPLLLLVPAVSALISPTILGETISPLGWLGILTVLLGGYLMKLEDLRRPLGPFLALRKESVMRFVAIAIITGVFCINLQKWLVLNSDPFTTLFATQATAALMAIPLGIKGCGGFSAIGKLTRAHLPALILLGIITAASGLTLLMAFERGGQVAYVLSVKRMSVIIISALGILALKESVRPPKIVGVACMLMGGFFLIHN